MKIIIYALCFSIVIFGQNIHVELDSLSTLDDIEFHLTLLSDNPKIKLIIPNIDSVKAKYCTLFYTHSSEKNENISILIDQQNNKDILYIDKNFNNDLTDDGTPIIFLHSQNEQYLNIHDKSDSNQILRLVIYRTPPFADSIKSEYVEDNGNLVPEFAKLWGELFDDPVFEGAKGTFFFDRVVTLRRGIVVLDSINYDIGLFDFTNNGLYNDDKDLLLIDLNKDGKLKFLDQEEVFSIKDVFRIGNSNYELTYIDKYGKILSLEKTTKKSTSYFLHYWQENSLQPSQYVLSDEFLETNFTSLSGKTISLKDFRGKYVLLNFWGEWCAPCRKEIPELVEGYNQWKEKVVFLGILKSQNLKKANDLISKENIVWPQILMTPELEAKFNITGYPANILIFPDGRTYTKEGQINRTFFELKIK